MAKDFLLLIPSLGGQNRAFEDNRIAWSAAIEILFEKHGMLSFDVKQANEIHTAEELQNYSAIVVGSMDRQDLTAELVANVCGFNGAVIWERPVDEFTVPGLSISKTSTWPKTRHSHITPNDEISAELARTCWASYGKDSNLARLSPRKVNVVRKRFDHITEQHKARFDDDWLSCARSISLSTLNAIFERQKRQPSLFPAHPMKGAAAVAAMCALNKLSDGLHEIPISTALMASINSIKSETFEKEFEFIEHRLQGDEDALFAQEKSANVYCNRVINAWDGTIDSIWEPLLGRPVTVVLLVVRRLKQLGHIQIAEALFLATRDALYDPQIGCFSNGIIGKNGIEIASGAANNAFIWLALFDLAPSLDMPHFASLLGRKYSEKIRSLWEKTPLLQPDCTINDTWEIIASHSDTEPLIVRKDNLLVFTTPLLSHLVHLHSNGPLADGFATEEFLPSMVIEALLLQVIESHMRQCNATFMKVKNWPKGYDYCYSVRHDVDRIPKPEVFDRLMKFHTDNNLGVTWFWLPWRLDQKQMKAQLEAGHEIGLHSVRVAEKEHERDLVKSCSGTDVLGEAVHGSASDAWLGVTTVEAAKEAGFRYCELAPDVRSHPYSGYPVISDDGKISILRGLIGLSYSDTVDPIPDYFTEQDTVLKLGICQEWAERGMHVVMLNHPDISFDALEKATLAYPRKGRLDWNFSEVADWWAKTHDHTQVTVERIEGATGKYQVQGFPAEAEFILMGALPDVTPEFEHVTY